MNILTKAAIVISAPFIAIGTLFTGGRKSDPIPLNLPIPTPFVEERQFGLALPQIYALYEDSLASSITASSTSMTLVRGTESKTSTSLSGDYLLTVDEGTSSEEFMVATCTGTACTMTAANRGLSPVDLSTHVYALTTSHRRGATVKITNASLIRLNNIINGAATIPNTLSYSSEPSFSPGSTELATVNYVDDIALAGCGDASSAQAGCLEVGTISELAASDSDGGSDAHLVATSGQFAAYSPGTQIIPVTNPSGTLDKSFITTATSYTWTGNHTFSVTATLSGVVSGKDYDWTWVQAGEALTTASSVYLSATDGKAYLTDYDGTYEASRFFGVVVSGVASGSNVFVARSGIIGGFTNLTIGGALYIGDAGTLTQTAPTTNIKRVGIAKSATEVWLQRSPVSRVRTGSVSAVGSATSVLGVRPQKITITGSCEPSSTADFGQFSITMVDGGLRGGYLLFHDDATGSDTSQFTGDFPYTVKCHENGASDSNVTITLRITDTAAEIQYATFSNGPPTLTYVMVAEE